MDDAETMSIEVKINEIKFSKREKLLQVILELSTKI